MRATLTCPRILLLTCLFIILTALGPAPSTFGAGAWRTFPAGQGDRAIPVPADYDGDGLTDLAYLDPASGDWHVIDSHDGYRGADHVVAQGFATRGATPLPADYDGDGKADPALVGLDAGRWRLTVRASGGDYAARASRWTIGSRLFNAFTADVDGDGRADALVYLPLEGTIHGLLSSQGFASGRGQTFELDTGVVNGKPFVVDYDNGLADANAPGDAVYPRGRDFLDDIALLGRDGVVTVIGSHYGRYDTQTTLVGFARREDTPVTGDFDGDGVTDVAVYRPGGGPNGGEFRALLSGQGFSPDHLLTYRLGSSDRDSRDTPVVGRYDLDLKTDFAVYQRGGAGAGQWSVAFSENGLNTPPTSYPSARYGLGMANWDDAAKTCYASELGLADSDSDGLAAGQVYPCDQHEMFYEAQGVAEMAQTFSQGGVTYRLHPRAMDVAWGNTLDPRANAMMLMFKYLAPTSALTDEQRRATLGYAHDVPGAVQVQFDLAQCNPATSGNCQDADGGRRLVYTNGSAIWQREAFKQWLIAHRQGAVGDSRRWYSFLVGSEMDYFARTSPPTYARILRDYTRFLAEVRDTVKADYGLTVRPTIVLSSAALNCTYWLGATAVRCENHPRATPDEDTWPGVAAYYTAVLQLLTRPGATDLDHDGQTSGPFEMWTREDAANFLSFFSAYSLDPFLYTPLAGDAFIGQPGQIQLSDLETYTQGAADAIRAQAAGFYDLPGCWNEASQRFEACRRPTHLPQLGTRYYSFRGQAWVGEPCPTQPPTAVCADIDRPPFDDARYSTLFATARLTQLLLANLDATPGHVGDTAYWLAVDTRHGQDPVSRGWLGSLDAALEPILDWDGECHGPPCVKSNLRFTPLGQVYWGAAAGNYSLRPDAFTYVGNNDEVSGTLRLTLPRPAWWP